MCVTFNGFCGSMEVCLFQRSYDMLMIFGPFMVTLDTYLHFVSIKLEYFRDFKGLFGGEHKRNMI